MTKEEMEVVQDIIARGARLYYPDGGEALIGFGTEIRPNLFYWAQPFFESSHDLHLFRFNDINIAHRSGVEFLTDLKPFCLGAGGSEKNGT